MSKSLGNVVDPVEVVEEYGTDALRFTLATGLSAKTSYPQGVWERVPGRGHVPACGSLCLCMGACACVHACVCV